MTLKNTQFSSLSPRQKIRKNAPKASEKRQNICVFRFFVPLFSLSVCVGECVQFLFPEHFFVFVLVSFWFSKRAPENTHKKQDSEVYAGPPYVVHVRLVFVFCEVCAAEQI